MTRRLIIIAVAFFICARVVIAVGNFITDARTAMLNCGTQTNHEEVK